MSERVHALKQLKKLLESFYLYDLWDTGINWKLNESSPKILKDSYK